MWLNGYTTDKWTLVEPDSEYGTYTICIDTDSDEEFDDLVKYYNSLTVD